MPNGLITANRADIRLSINGKAYFESWASYAGGYLTANAAASRSGGMGPQRKTGGPPMRGDITLTIDWDDVVAGFFNEMEAYVGNGWADVSIQWLEPNRAAIPGAHFTRHGVVIDVHFSDADARNDSPEVGQLTVVIAAEELAS